MQCTFTYPNPGVQRSKSTLATESSECRSAQEHNFLQVELQDTHRTDRRLENRWLGDTQIARATVKTHDWKSNIGCPISRLHASAMEIEEAGDLAVVTGPCGRAKDPMALVMSRLFLQLTDDTL